MKPLLKTCFTLFALASQASFAQTLHLIGDATMANQAADTYPQTGWGQVLARFSTGPLIVKNHAVAGRSSRSFIEEGRWATVRDTLQPGDYLIIQFGHEDQNTGEPERFTEADTRYRDNLLRFVTEARSLNVSPILVTPICRRRFGEQGDLLETHGAYPQVVRTLAAQYAVPLVDLQALTAELLQNYGDEASKRLYLHAASGQLTYYPQGVEDDTHLSERGALEVADLFVEGLKATDVSLNDFFAPESLSIK